ncbi:MAG: hypothetical protein GQE15_34890 [Archangiaceae bacterium]|nr:hypothetical protein [Archangiaceae bacterium]
MHSGALGLLCAVALAHGTPPQTLGVSQSPWSSNGLVAPTTFGLLVTADRCTWQWVCSDHLGLADREQPSWFTTPGGAVIATAFSGLYLSRDRGCSFTKVPFFSATGAADFVVSDGSWWITTAKFGVTNGLARSTDDGSTFEWTSLKADQTFFNAVRVAPSRPQRLYVSSWYFEPRLLRLSVSDDRGQTLSAIDLPTTVAVGNVFTVHAVDASNADLVFASIVDDTSMPERTSLLRSSDAGRTFSVVLQADGRVNGMRQVNGVWWVAVGDRVFSSTDGSSFTALDSPKQRACVGGAGDETLVCGRLVADQFVIGSLSGAPILTWNQLTGPIECPAESPAAKACSITWPVERAELGLATDHVATCDGMKPTPVARGGGCQTTLTPLWFVSVVFFLRRSRRVESSALR